ncbi:exosome complex protein Rrp42 [Candidatus Woesearchaeota archaeon]|nr:MAG: exosome complex protein Rrp42 [Candidatus Woesearchaeota archaeon]
MMNEDIKHDLIQSLSKNLRVDLRKNEDLRSIEIETGCVATAEGSARVKFGDTEVIAGVKLAVEKPFPDTPEDAILMVASEMLPLSNPKYEGGPPGVDAIEMARVIDRSFRESRCIETKKLCIQKGEKVWSIAIDIAPLNDDGNLLDVGAFAALLALQNTVFPEYDGTKVLVDKKTTMKLPMVREPITVTVFKIGNAFVVDPTETEQTSFDARMTFAILADDKICSMQKGGDTAIMEEDLDIMLDIAIKTSQELRKKIPR